LKPVEIGLDKVYEGLKILDTAKMVFL